MMSNKKEVETERVPASFIATRYAVEAAAHHANVTGKDLEVNVRSSEVVIRVLPKPDEK